MPLLLSPPKMDPLLPHLSPELFMHQGDIFGGSIDFTESALSLEKRPLHQRGEGYLSNVGKVHQFSKLKGHKRQQYLLAIIV